jgi:hypothetical protein
MSPFIFTNFANLKLRHRVCLFVIYHDVQKEAHMAKEQNYPLIFASAYSQEAGDGFSVAGGDGIIRTSEMLRSAGDMWLAQHRWLMAQGYPPLEATRHLIDQTKKLAQPQAQAQPVPPPFPSPPFAQQPAVNGAPQHGR